MYKIGHNCYTRNTGLPCLIGGTRFNSHEKLFMLLGVDTHTHVCTHILHTHRHKQPATCCCVPGLTRLQNAYGSHYISTRHTKM